MEVLSIEQSGPRTGPYIELLSINLTFTQQSNPPSLPKKTYRKPFYLAWEYKEMIDSGKVKNQAELAKIKGISRTRVTQILNLLKLDKEILHYLE